MTMKVILLEYDFKCRYINGPSKYYAVHTLRCMHFSATPPLCIFLRSNLKLLHSEVHHAFFSYIYIHLIAENYDKSWFLKMVPIR